MTYDELKKHEICVICKKRKSKRNRVKCNICLEKDRIFRKEHKIYKLCSVCNLLYPPKEMINENCYLCEQEKLLKKLRKILVGREKK